MYEHSRTEYQAPDGTRYRVRIVADEDAMSPRDADNVTIMDTFDSGYYSPDVIEGSTHGARYADEIDLPGEYIDGGVDMRRASRYVNLFMPEVLAFAGLHRRHDGSLFVSFDNDGDADGYVAITRKTWEMCMGDSPLEGAPWLLTRKGEPDPENLEGNRIPSAREAIQQDVDAYNRWAEGSYVGYIVEKAVQYVRTDSIDNEGAYDDEDTMFEWEDVDSLWGIDDEDYALEEAVATLPEGSVQA